MNLKTYNTILAIIHFTLAGAFYIYFKNINKKYKNDPVKGVELSIRDHTLKIQDNIDKTTTANWESTQNKLVSLNTVQNLLISFFFITGLFHLYYAVSQKHYKDMILKGNNYVRWIEYSITSTMMLYIIALLSGVKDTNIYILIFSTNVAMIAQGQLVEEAVANKKEWWLPMLTGFILLMAEFLVIIRDFQRRIKEVDKYLSNKQDQDTTRKIPKWLYYMIFVLFAFFASFGFISLYQAASGTPYENIEKLYLLFSLLSKATLGGFMAYGLGQRVTNQTKN